jgi:hypothetical protein
MKYLIYYFIPVLLMVSCRQNDTKVSELQKEIDSLKTKLNNVYKPGFGSSMNQANYHFKEIKTAGIKQNWQYASFEIHEMKEEFENIEKFQKNRKETNLLKMLDKPIEELEKAVKNKDTFEFNKKYKLLLNTCNSCHKLTNYEFIKIK